MREEKGFALVASLVLLVVLMALGSGAIFLTQMNLRITENRQSGAVARYNAEGALDSLFVVLAGAVKATGEVPEDLAEFREAYPTFENAAYTFAANNSYTVFPDGTVRVRVVGMGPNSARYEAEALIEPVIVATPGTEDYTIFGEGFVSKRSITMNGNGTFDINFWSGGDINLGAATLMKGRTASAAGSCSFKKGEGTCLGDQGPPDVPMPDFDGFRNQLVADIQEDIPGFSWATCEKVSGSYYATPYTDSTPKVICVNSASLNLTGNPSNLIVIGDGHTTVNLNGATGSASDDSVPGVTVVSGTITFNSALRGTNTFFAKNNISFGQNVVSHDETARTFIATEGNFTLNGAGTSDIYASFWVGGTFTVNGTGNRTRATIVANDTIIKNGGGSFATVKPPAYLDNPYIPTTPHPSTTGAGIRVVSRR